ARVVIDTLINASAIAETQCRGDQESPIVEGCPCIRRLLVCWKGVAHPCRRTPVRSAHIGNQLAVRGCNQVSASAIDLQYGARAEASIAIVNRHRTRPPAIRKYVRPNE